ncbi:MAG: hypothetical protein WEC14_10395 [Chloroflexota bacterium]
MTASFERDGDIEALVVDRYLESLLARDTVVPDGVPAEMQRTARRLATDLPRHHPSFRFEEALAARLAAVAGRIGAGELVDLPLPLDQEVMAVRGADGSARSALMRPVLIGGVLTSAALSIAGAVFVAWRRARPVDPMARAARAVARARLA